MEGRPIPYIPLFLFCAFAPLTVQLRTLLLSLNANSILSMVVLVVDAMRDAGVVKENRFLIANRGADSWRDCEQLNDHKKGRPERRIGSILTRV